MKLGHLLAEVFFGICAVAPGPTKGGTGHILGTLGFRVDRAKSFAALAFSQIPYNASSFQGLRRSRAVLGFMTVKLISLYYVKV